MQFESLKLFCDVARHRSFSRAAVENHVSQSAASQIVLQLERRVGVLLINRATRPLQLTKLGQTYYEGCRGLVEQYLDLEASIRSAQAELAASVQVAAIYSVGLSDMGQLVNRFLAQHPQTRVHVDYVHPAQVYERVLNGTSDFGLVSFPRRSRKLEVIPWREEAMVVVCSPAHPLAGHASVRPGQLHGEKYVGFDHGLPIRREIDRFFRVHDLAVDLTMAFDSIENIKKAVEVSGGVALLPEPTVREEVAKCTLAALPLAGATFVRPLGIILRRNHRLGHAARRFLEMLRSPAASGSNLTPSAPEPTSNGAKLARNHESGNGRVGSPKKGAIRAPSRRTNEN